MIIAKISGGLYLIGHIGDFQIVESEVFPCHPALPFKVMLALAVSLAPLLSW